MNGANLILNQSHKEEYESFAGDLVIEHTNKNVTADCTILDKEIIGDDKIRED